MKDEFVQCNRQPREKLNRGKNYRVTYRLNSDSETDITSYLFYVFRFLFVLSAKYMTLVHTRY